MQTNEEMEAAPKNEVTAQYDPNQYSTAQNYAIQDSTTQYDTSQYDGQIRVEWTEKNQLPEELHK